MTCENDDCKCAEPCTDCECEKEECLEQSVQENNQDNVEKVVESAEENKSLEEDFSFANRPKYNDPIEDDYHIERRNKVGGLENLNHNIDDDSAL